MKTLERVPTSTREPEGINLEASDVSGQKRSKASRVPPGYTVGELVEALIDGMRLPRNGANGAPLVYQARLEREGRHLHSSELVGQALREQDHIVLHPNIDTGRGQGS